jgi:hypothetical protein
MSIKKLLGVLGFGSLAGFVTFFAKISSFARFDMLIGTRGDLVNVEATASKATYDGIRLAAGLLTAITDTVFNHAAASGITAVLLVLTALLAVNRDHRTDCALLLAVLVASVSLSLFLVAPWLRVSNVLRDQALRPASIPEIRGDSYLAQRARANWVCLTCAHLPDAEFAQFGCPHGLLPPQAAQSLNGQLSATAVLTLLLVAAFATIFWARGDWLEIKPGAGLTLAVLAVVSLGTYVALAGNVYAVAYVHGKAVAETRFARYSRTVADDIVTGFAVAATDKKITYLSTIASVEEADLASVTPLNTSADVIGEFAVQLARQMKKMRQEAADATDQHSPGSTH